jgi:predicted nucleic acid-binding Zn finger protein
MIDQVIRYDMPSFTTPGVVYDVVLGVRHTCSCKSFAAKTLQQGFGECKHISEACFMAEEDGSFEALESAPKSLMDGELWTEAFGLEAVARAYQDGLRLGRALSEQARG